MSVVGFRKCQAYAHRIIIPSAALRWTQAVLLSRCCRRKEPTSAKLDTAARGESAEQGIAGGWCTRDSCETRNTGPPGLRLPPTVASHRQKGSGIVGFQRSARTWCPPCASCRSAPLFYCPSTCIYSCLYTHGHHLLDSIKRATHTGESTRSLNLRPHELFFDCARQHHPAATAAHTHVSDTLVFRWPLPVAAACLPLPTEVRLLAFDFSQRPGRGARCARVSNHACSVGLTCWSKKGGKSTVDAQEKENDERHLSCCPAPPPCSPALAHVPLRGA